MLTLVKSDGLFYELNSLMCSFVKLKVEQNAISNLLLKEKSTLKVIVRLELFGLATKPLIFTQNAETQFRLWTLSIL